MLSDIIYKRTSAGKIQMWQIETQDNKYRTISGQTDGKKTTSSWTECFGKNTGKANETTDAEQAQAQAEAKFTKKLEGHYHRDINNADEAKFVKAMLAHKYGEYPTDFNNSYSQPKLDGMRCLVTPAGMFSRGGKPINSAPHVAEHIGIVDPRVLSFDGELYASHLRDDFEKLISLAKKSKPKAEDLVESAKHLQYWIYDIITVEPMTFVERQELLTEILTANEHSALGDDDEQISKDTFWNGLSGKASKSLVFTPTEKVRDQEHMDELYQGYLSAGQEGQMLRKGDSLYEGKRSKNLLKRKEFIDEEFTIVELTEGKGNYQGLIKSIKLRNKDGKEFSSGIKGNQKYLLSLMSKTLAPNSEATVRYQNLTADGIPRFPVVYHIWDGKRDV